MKYDEFEIIEAMDENKLTKEEQKKIHALAMAKINDKTETVNISAFKETEAEAPATAPKRLGFLKCALAAAAAVVLCGGAFIAGMQIMKNTDITSGASVETGTPTEADYSAWQKSEFDYLPSQQFDFSIFTERQSYDLGTEKIRYYVTYAPTDLPANPTEEEMWSATAGEECTVEKLVDGEWLIPPAELMFNSLGYMFSSDGTPVEFSIWLNSYENMLTEGHYRVVKTVNGSGGSVTLAAEFDLISSDYNKEEHIETAINVFKGDQLKTDSYIEIHDKEASDTAAIYGFRFGGDKKSYLIVRVEDNGVVTVYDITRCGLLYHIIKCTAADNADGYSTEYFTTQYLSVDNADGVTENADTLVYQNEDGGTSPLFSYIAPLTENKVLWSAQTGENTVRLVATLGYEYDNRFTGSFSLQLVGADGAVISETDLLTGMVGLDGISLPIDGLDDYFKLYELENGTALAFSYPFEERYLEICEEKQKYYLTSFYGIKSDYIGRFMMGSQASTTAMPNEGETLLTHSFQLVGDSLKTAIWWDLQNGLTDESIGLPQVDVTFDFDFERLGDLTYSGYSAVCSTETVASIGLNDEYTQTVGVNDYSVDGIVSYSPGTEVTITSYLPDGWFAIGNRYYDERGVKQDIRVEAVKDETFEHFVERNMGEAFYSADIYTVKRGEAHTAIFNEVFTVNSVKLNVLNKETGEQSTVRLAHISNQTGIYVTMRAVDTDADITLSYSIGSAKEPLTLDIVRELAQKGEELTWSDFEQYKSIETGSGLYILIYEIDESFNLIIGGVPDESPMYMRLVRTTDDDSYIDIRTEDVESFIAG